MTAEEYAGVERGYAASKEVAVAVGQAALTADMLRLVKEAFTEAGGRVESEMRRRLIQSRDG